MKNAKAVSPVIATLMLVLVAVGAAGAFYVWQADWQEGTTEGVENVEAGKIELDIAGSSTVYDVLVEGVEMFMEDNPGWKINLNAGGSSAGIAGAGTGVIDIGMASKVVTTPDPTYPDIHVYTIGTDDVSIIVSNSNTHGLSSIDANTLYDIYAGYNINVRGSGGYSLQYRSSWDDGDNILEWEEIPKEIGGSTKCDGTGQIVAYERTEGSGTETTFATIACGIAGADQLQDGMPTGYPGNSGVLGGMENPDLLAAVAADANGIGFNSHGISGEAGSGVKHVAFGTSHATALTSGNPGYLVNRPLNLITDGEKSGKVAVFIDYILNPDINTGLLPATGFSSIY